MAEIKLGIVEARFSDIIWENAPLTTKELTILCEKELNWKRTTTYTVLKKLCDRGIFCTKDGVVSVVLSKDEFFAIQSEQFVQENFHGSLPAFIAAFTTRKSPTPEELTQIRTMIESYEEENL
ncbi:MAG: BlaI/MecI/CopY family transcriptional regulator [Oscillospiraceae bacterium]|nr:BlaI/MecI/CopY family transcriptional regulator [Oscillospiraceae bacterium]